jgi:predicted flavoprotein YhiN
MKHFDIIILGAGAAGCMCALTSAKNDKNILLIDKLSRAGKKLLATGNGRCNLTNTNMSEYVTFAVRIDKES